MNKNEYHNYIENDWKLFKSKISLWQEKYIHHLNEEYITILSQKKSSSENFIELVKRIDRDRHRPGVIIELRKSMMVVNLIDLLIDGVITMKALDDFSNELKEELRPWKKYSS